MNLVDERMEQAASDLQAVTRTVPIPNSPGQRPYQREGRRVRRVGAMVVAFVAALLIGLPAVLLNPDGDSLIGSEVAAPDRPESSTPAAPTAPDELPFLLVDTSLIGDLNLVSVVESETSSEESENYLAAYTTADDAAVGSRIWIVTHAEGTDFFRGEGYLDGDWEEAAVDSGRAYILRNPETPLVIWDTTSGDEGPAVLAYGLDVEAEDLTQVVNGLVDNGDGWEATNLPETFSKIYSGPERVDGRRISLGWLDQDNTSEILLELVDEGPLTLEQTI